MASLDPKRFGGWMTTEYAARKNEEAYDHVFILHHPDEERPAARPLRTSPAYDRQKARGAQFGQVNGWERPIYYGPLTRPRASTTTPRAASAAAAGGSTRSRRRRAIRESGRADRRHRLRQAPREGAGRDGLPRLVHHQQAAQGRPHQPDLRADRRRGRRGPNTPSCGSREDDYYLVSAGAWADYDARLPAQVRRGHGGALRPRSRCRT